MNNDSFENLNLVNPILRALEQEGYKAPTAIQVAAIPEVLAGRDLMATAQTGTGKTAAFSLPMLQLLSERQFSYGNGNGNGNGNDKNGPKGARALILTPTRELAVQIDASFRAYGRHLQLRTAVLLGGVPMGAQIKALQRKPDIIVATPGRLLDLVQQNRVRLQHVEILVLDEADRMLDMGFIHDVRRIVDLTPRDRQTLLFSATLTPDIAGLAADMLRDPSYVEVARSTTVGGEISQKVMFVQRNNKFALLADMLRDKSMGRTLVFTRTKHKADRISKSLSREGIMADAIHSNKTQNARQRALAGFERGRVQILVATDIVARGIDVDGISHVINYELPNDAESYVHRIGRTARAGANGIAYSFCDAEEISMLRAIEKLTKSTLDAHNDHPYHSESIGALRNRSSAPKAAPKRSGVRGGGSGAGGSRPGASRNRKRPSSRSRRTYR